MGDSPKRGLHLIGVAPGYPGFRNQQTFGIDYCCGGSQLLDQACGKAGIPVDEVLDALEMQEETARLAEQLHDWQSEPLSELIARIKNTHHKFTRDEIFMLTAPRLL
jgi:iron-sulfur cluster repair protein YtfE (RIC family)